MLDRILCQKKIMSFIMFFCAVFNIKNNCGKIQFFNNFVYLNICRNKGRKWYLLYIKGGCNIMSLWHLVQNLSRSVVFSLFSYWIRSSMYFIPEMTQGIANLPVTKYKNWNDSPTWIPSFQIDVFLFFFKVIESFWWVFLLFLPVIE